MKNRHTVARTPGVGKDNKEPVPASTNPHELTQVQQAALEDFVEEMTGKVIPEIVRIVEERRVLATHSREWPLKVGG